MTKLCRYKEKQISPLRCEMTNLKMLRAEVISISGCTYSNKRYLPIPLKPQLIETPSRNRAVIHYFAIHNHPLKLIHAYSTHFQIMLFRIALRLTRFQVLRQIDMVDLPHLPIGNPLVP